MKNKILLAVLVANALAASSLWAADKECLKKAKADYTTAGKACKDLKGAEKKACAKDAKANYKTAKEACSAPAAK